MKAIDEEYFWGKKCIESLIWCKKGSSAHDPGATSIDRAEELDHSLYLPVYVSLLLTFNGLFHAS